MAPIAIAPALGTSTSERDGVGAKKTGSASFDGELARQLLTRAPVQTSSSGGARTSDAHGDAQPTRTPLTGSEAASALSKAWQTVTGQTANPKLLSILVAQWSHETGRGESMLNYNFGGLKGSSPAGLTAAYRTHEGSGATARVTTDHFRAYRTAAEGAVDYVRFLRARFPAALDAAQTGDASGFVHALKQSGYFTDNETDYARSVTELAKRAERSGFDAVGAVTSRAANGPAIANMSGGGSSPLVDSGALANEIAQAAMRIAHSTPEDYLHEIERLDTARKTT